MHNQKMKYTSFLLLFCLWPSLGHSTTLLEEMYSKYRQLVRAETVEEIETFYTSEFNNELKWHFKTLCGFLCVIGIKNTWKKSYENYILTSNKVKKEIFVIMYYSIESKENHYTLTLLKESCNGNKQSQEKLHYSFINNEFSINSVEFSSWNKRSITSFPIDIELPYKC